MAEMWDNLFRGVDSNAWGAAAPSQQPTAAPNMNMWPGANMAAAQNSAFQRAEVPTWQPRETDAGMQARIRNEMNTRYAAMLAEQQGNIQPFQGPRGPVDATYARIHDETNNALQGEFLRMKLERLFGPNR
jgi:hypothetical protein